MTLNCVLTAILLCLQVSLLEENIKPRTDLPPLLVHLCERKPEKLHYIGVSFGLTLDLLRFWRKQKFAPFYVAHNPVKIFEMIPLMVFCLSFSVTVFDIHINLNTESCYW